MRPCRVDASIERLRRAAHRLQAHRRGRVCRAPQHPGVVHQQRREAGLRLGAVHERQPLFRFQLDRLQARGPERGAVIPLADQREREMRQRRQVARRSHAALGRHARMHAGVEHRDEELRQAGPHAARAPHEHVGTQQHHCAHRLSGQRLAHAGGMAANQVELELADPLGGNADVGELAEPGRDAVHRRASRQGRFDHLATPPDLAQRARGDRHRRLVARHRYDVRNRQRAAVDGDLSGHTGGNYEGARPPQPPAAWRLVKSRFSAAWRPSSPSASP